MEIKDNECKYDGILCTLSEIEEKIAKLQEGVKKIKLKLKLSLYDKTVEKSILEQETEGDK